MVWLLGFLIGLLMGVTGAGGGVLAVPALVFGLRLPMQQAAPIALVGVSIAAWVGALEGLRRGVVRWRAAIVIALAAAPFTALGLAVARHVSDLALRVVFVAVLCFVAWRQLASLAPRDEAEALQTRGHVAVLDPATGRFIWSARAVAGFCGIGSVMGFLSGLLGVSGGFVLVPLLTRLTPLNAPMLVGTSLLVSAMVTTFGAAMAAAQGASLPWPATGWFAASLVAGMVGGRLVVRRLPPDWIRRAFVALVMAVAVVMALDVVRRLVAG